MSAELAPPATSAAICTQGLLARAQQPTALARGRLGAQSVLDIDEVATTPRPSDVAIGTEANETANVFPSRRKNHSRSLTPKPAKSVRE